MGEERSYRVSDICLAHGVSRQGYYQYQRYQCQHRYQEEIVLQLVCGLRRRQPRLGVRKLYHLLREEFEQLDFRIGRDKLFSILGEHGLLIERKRNYRTTTESYHRFKVYDNLLKDAEIRKVNQACVADLTYLSTRERFVYLALVTDVFSRKIIGHDVSASLSIEGSLRALKEALRGVGSKEGLIHHSDRGIQYCSHEYTGLLKKVGAQISMAEKGNPYENAIAERINGILKIEFLLDQRFSSLVEAKTCAREAIRIYNEERPHLSLDYRTPAEVYRMERAA